MILRRALALGLAAALVSRLDPQSPAGAAGAAALTPSVAQTPPRDQRRSARGTGQVRGLVVDADSGQPIRRASVSLFVNATASGESQSFSAVSDGEGRFVIGDLPAGELHLNARHEAYYDPREDGGPSGYRAPVLGDGQVVDGVRLSLKRTTAIAGRILDEYGEPAVGVRVQAIRLADASGREAASSFGAGNSVNTDDTGAFRTWGLRPGRYLVNADPGSRVGGAGFGGTTPRRDGHAPTYYPGTPDSASAGQIVVRAGQDTTGVTFALVTARLASISGTVVTPEGVSPRGLNVMVGRLDPLRSDGAMSGRSAEGDGSFEIRSLPPGTYRISAQETTSRDRIAVLYGETVVDVNGDDLDGVVLSVKRTGRITGRVIADDAPMPAGLNVNVMARPPTTGGRMWSGPFIRPAEVRGDGTFVIEGAYGRIELRASVSTRSTPGPAGTPPPVRWQLDAVRLDGRDITDQVIEIDEREIEVEVAFTSQVTRVSGTVTWDRSASSADRQPVIVVFPDDPDRWQGPSRWIRTSLAGDDGRFEVQGLPPGEDYLAVAVEGGPFPNLTSRGVLEGLRPAGTPFDLVRGAVPELSLRAVPRPRP